VPYLALDRLWSPFEYQRSTYHCTDANYCPLFSRSTYCHALHSTTNPYTAAYSVAKDANHCECSTTNDISKLQVVPVYRDALSAGWSITNSALLALV
jgi:hypothetical protein